MGTTAVNANTGEEQALACLEVWGGNEPVDVRLAVPGMQVHVYASPYEGATAGGDVHFVSSCGSGRIARMMVADVSGHGDAVAETARTLRGLIHRYMNHIDQRKLIMGMNEQFTALAQAGRFATAVVITYFSPDGSMSICNAGHPPPLVYRRSQRSWEFLDAKEDASEGVANIPLGILADAGYEQFQVQLDQGDLVLCYSDSLIESVLPGGGLLEQSGLVKILAAVDSVDSTAVVPRLLEQLRSAGITLNDDVTILLCRCDGRANGAPFFKKIWGELKVVAKILTFRPNAPWPEFSLQNLGGSILPRLFNRQRAEKSKTGG